MDLAKVKAALLNVKNEAFRFGLENPDLLSKDEKAVFSDQQVEKAIQEALKEISGSTPDVF